MRGKVVNEWLLRMVPGRSDIDLLVEFGERRGVCTRRDFVAAFSVGAIGGLVFPASEALKAVRAAENTLQDIAAQKGLIYGCATSQDQLTADPAFEQLVVNQCGLLVPENALNWKYVEPDPGRFDFHMGDWLANFAKDHHMKFGGGTIVWNQALPAWVSSLAPADARRVMLQHVTQSVSHFRGRAWYWAVVNEAKAFREAGTELKDTPFLRLVGPDYIDAAFHAASAADPNAILMYNDNHLEYDIPEDEYGRKTLLKLLKRLLDAKVPIGALGIQSHLRTGGVPFDGGKLKEFLSRVSDLGLKIVVSELDVTEKGPETEVADRDKAVANEISRYLNVVLQEKAVVAVVSWGLSSRYSWLASYARRPDGQQVRPLPYDSDLHPTQAWQALAAAFGSAPQR
jgi:endo-1,4-beta-xylanase